jgi:hypothetical protein
MYTLSCGIWNILADGLANGEFMTNGGDIINVDWNTRRSKILECIEQMLNICGFVVTIENDHFHYFLNELNKKFNNEIGGVYYLEVNIVDGKPTTDKKEFSSARKFRKMDSNITFLDECQAYADDFSSLYNLNANDSYISDDGIAIYYNKNILEFVSVFDKTKLNSTDIPIYGGNEQYFISNFKHIQSNSTINICSAHLSSGEEMNKEEERVKKLTNIFCSLGNIPNVIILMDSNSSNLYESEYKKLNNKFTTMNNLISQYDYKNLVITEYNECYKMRHAQGGQATKYGQLMFDTIDKILVKNNMPAYEINNTFGFTKYPKFIYDTILDWRTNSDKRNIIFKYTANINNFKARPNYLKQDVTDKNGKLLFEMDANIENRWGDDMNNNDTSGLAKLLNFKKLIQYETLDPNLQIKEVFNQLYPNQHAPSDHPPIAVNIHLGIDNLSMRQIVSNLYYEKYLKYKCKYLDLLQ